MSGVPDYDELFGGAKRGSFAVKRAMRKAKDTVGYIPQAKPNPVRYSDVGKKSEHLQKTIGAVPDGDIEPFQREPLPESEKERNLRLKPETWGIDPSDLEYNERQNRSYFQVDDVEGWFAFPPVKWTDSKGKEYYGLAHYEEKPSEDAKDIGEGGEHFDSIAFHADDIPPEAINGDFSLGYTSSTLGKNPSYTGADKADYMVEINNNGKELALAKGAVGHPRGKEKISNEEKRYGFWVKEVAGDETPELSEPNATLPEDASEKERVKVWRQICSINTLLENEAMWWGDRNNEANYYLHRHETSMDFIERQDEYLNGKPRDNETQPRTNQMINLRQRFDKDNVGTFQRPVLRTDGRRSNPKVYNPRAGEKYTVKYKKNGILMTKQATRPNFIRKPGDGINKAQEGTPRRHPAVPMGWTNNWKASYAKIKRSADGLPTDKKDAKGKTIYETPRGGAWDDIAGYSVPQQEVRQEAVRENDDLLKKLGYDGRFTLPSRRVWKPRPHWWDDDETKATKKTEMENWDETVPELTEAIKDGTAPALWWDATNMLQHYGG